MEQYYNGRTRVMNYTVRATTGHLMHISPCEVSEIPDIEGQDPRYQHKNNFSKYYAVRNGDETGIIFMYITRGHRDAPQQVCVFYRNGEMWNSYGDSFGKAIEGAISDAWKDGIRGA